MWKNSDIEDEIPLTRSTANITQETRARFDSLLLAALRQEKQQKQKFKDGRELQDKDELEEKQKSATRKKKLRSIENNLVASDNGSQCSSSHSKDGEVTVKEQRVQKGDRGDTDSDKVVILNKKLKNETNESKASHAKNIDSVKDTNETGNENELHVIEAKSESNSSLQEIVSSLTISDKPKESKKPVPLPRQKSLLSSVEVHKKLKPEDCFKESLNGNRNEGHDELSVIKNIQSLNIKSMNDESLPKTERRKKKKQKNKDENTGIEIELQQFKHGSSPSTRRKKANIGEQRTKKPSKEAQKAAETEAMKSSTAEQSTNKIIGVHIHKSDYLEIDPLIRHPIVKVHLLDAATGHYLKKSATERPASFFYESEDLDYILPLMTEVFEYKIRKSLIPQWEELLIFNENFDYILTDDPSVLIIFEILDFVNFDIASSQYRKLGTEGGWYKIAWAFLKPVGANGVLNVNKQVRLQLYKPRKKHKKNDGDCDVYEWWISGEWEKYPATLYVTLQGISPPEQLSPALRSRSVLQGELNEDMQLDLEQREHNDEKDITNSENEDSLAAHLLSKMMQPNNVPLWSRLPLQSCQIPNMRRLLLPTAPKGCFTLQFSNNGFFLACATVGEEKFNITVYTIPEGKLFTTLCGHLGLVYDLDWSSSDNMLVSASADCTVCLWNMEKPTSQSIQMLPHPSFVYSVCFHPGNSSILATGCCDHVVRIWNRPRKSQFELIQELEGHSGFINAVTMNILTNAMYTGDSKGGIIEWTATKVKSKRLQMKWKLNRKFDLTELRDTVVNRLVLHPQGRRLLIHARDSHLRMLDIATGAVIQWYNGALNHRFQTYACISPCGGLVISGSEDGTVYVWQTDTGDQLAVYSGLHFQRGANAVHYHPHEHMAAFGSYGSPVHVIVCSYDRKSSGKDIGLQIMSHKDSAEDKMLTYETSSSKFTLSPLQGLKQSGTQAGSKDVGDFKDSSRDLTNSRTTVEEAMSICSTNASTVNLGSILEKMEKFLQKSSPSSKKALESATNDAS